MYTKLTNMIGKIKYALYRVKLNAQFHTFTRVPTQRHLRHLSPASLMTQMGKCSSRSTKFTTSMNWR